MLLAASAKQNGHEDHAGRHARIGAGAKADGAPPGLDRDRRAWLDVHALKLRRREMGDRFGLQVVEHRGAPGHGARVPMLEHPSRGEHHGELVVGCLVGRYDPGGHELAPLARGRIAVLEDHVLGPGSSSPSQG